MMRKGKCIMAGLFCFSMLAGLFGCNKGKPQNSEYISGGTIDKTNTNAPKVIQSKSISSFYTNVYLRNRWTVEEKHTFQFSVKKDENDVLTAYEEISGIHLPADTNLMTELQNVIDENNLASQNGVYKVTAGLPPEYQKCELLIDYASGETLKFTVNNDPDAKWAEDVYTVFAKWFSEKGDDSLLPLKETSQITRIDVDFIDKGLLFQYGGIKVLEENAIDGETYLLKKSVYDVAAKKEISKNYILFPEDYYKKVTEIFDGYDLATKYDFSYFEHDSGYYGLGDTKTNEDSDDTSLELYIKYESGRVLNISTKKTSEIEGIKPLLTELFKYYDSLF